MNLPHEFPMHPLVLLHFNNVLDISESQGPKGFIIWLTLANDKGFYSHTTYLVARVRRDRLRCKHSTQAGKYICTSRVQYRNLMYMHAGKIIVFECENHRRCCAYRCGTPSDAAFKRHASMYPALNAGLLYTFFSSPLCPSRLACLHSFLWRKQERKRTKMPFRPHVSKTIGTRYQHHSHEV